MSVQVAIEVEQEEGEGGMVGETFTDYVRIIIIKIDFVNYI